MSKPASPPSSRRIPPAAPFLSQKAADEKTGKTRATLSDVVANIDHMKQITGINAVGPGTDFDGINYDGFHPCP